jgi:methyl-accepting chemotaxis protein
MRVSIPSIQGKLMLMCALLVGVTTLGMSAAYYGLTRQDARRESRQRIQIALDIIMDDVTTLQQAYRERIDQFLQGSPTLIVTMEMLGMQNVYELSSMPFIATYLPRLDDEFKKLRSLVRANQWAIYGADRRLLTVYQRDGRQETMGVYVVSESGEDTYLPVESSSALADRLLDEQAIPDRPLPAGVAGTYTGPIPDHARAELFSQAANLGFRIIAPIPMSEDKTGILSCDVLFTPQMVERYASLSKTEVNLFSGQQLSVGTLPAQSPLAPNALGHLIPCDDPRRAQTLSILPKTIAGQAYYQSQCQLSNNGQPVGAITVNLSQAIEKAENQKILRAILFIAGLVMVIAFGVALLMSRATINAIHTIVQVIGAAAEGDLRSTAAVPTRDEIGMLAERVNQMIGQLRHISGQVQQAAYTVNTTADKVLSQMQRLTQRMQEQALTVDEATDSSEEINQFIETVARNTADLLAVAEQVLSSIQETRASIEEVSMSTGALAQNLQQISTSIEQVNEATRQISQNTGQLADTAQTTAAEIHHIDQSFQDVSQNAEDTQRFARETMEAVTNGQASVQASLEGMAELKAIVANAADIIEEVNSWGEQVSSILTMVDEITEQTSLLALNASIISAQAGEHGRGFAVVADEIKELATRTKTSTQEIGALISALQQKTGEGVRNIAEGLTKADQEMHLANTVKDVLDMILDSATRSASKATDTARVIHQTSGSSRAIQTSMSRVTEMVAHIKTAIQSQEQDIQQVLEAVENISGMSEQVNRASIEQKKTANQIAESMEEVTGKFNNISNQTETLQHNSTQIVNAMHTIDSTTEEIASQANTISGETVRKIVQQSELLREIVQVFRV